MIFIFLAAVNAVAITSRERERNIFFIYEISSLFHLYFIIFSQGLLLILSMCAIPLQTARMGYRLSEAKQSMYVD